MKRKLFRRRNVLLLLAGGLSASLPLQVRAQQPSGTRQVGLLMPLGEADPQGQARMSILRKALEERGWVENQNLRINVRWGPGDNRRYRELATELVAQAPDLLLAGGGLVVSPLQQATKSIPIVFTATVDPVALGYVTNLRPPGGNTTGFINSLISVLILNCPPR